MLNSEKILKLNLPKGGYAIFGSGPMAIRGLRPSRDIDIIVTNDVFEKYKKGEEWKLVKFERDGRKIEMLEKDDFELYPTWGPGDWDIEKLVEEAEIIDGLPFVRLEAVLKWKKISARKKDREDVKLIKEYLSSK